MVTEKYGSNSDLRKKLLNNVVGSALLVMTSKFLMIATSILLARLMGAASYGIYATAIALVFLLVVPTALGLPILLIRLLASYRLHEQWGLMRGLLIRSNQIVFVLSVFIATIAAVVIWMAADYLGPVKASVFGLALVLVPLMAMGALRSAALRGLHHVVLGQVPESLIMPLLFVLFTVGLWLLNVVAGELPANVAIVARIVATAVAFIVGAVLLYRKIPSEMRNAVPKFEVNAWVRSALPLLFVGGITIINMQIDVLMLAALSGNESAGIYHAAARGAELITFSIVIINFAIQPSISRLYSEGDKIRLQRMVTFGTRVAVVAAIPLALVMIVWGKPIMVNVFGLDFGRGASALAVLAGAQLINVATGSVNELLNMTGHEYDTLIGMAIGFFANIALNFLLIPIWDTVGAAVAVGVSLVLWNIILVIQVRRRTAIKPTVFGFI